LPGDFPNFAVLTPTGEPRENGEPYRAVPIPRTLTEFGARSKR
jgi:hypothetical protein